MPSMPMRPARTIRCACGGTNTRPCVKSSTCFSFHFSRVAKGELLAQLDDRDETLALRDAETALAETKNALELAKLAVEDAVELKTGAGNTARQAQRDYERDRQLAESKDVAASQPAVMKRVEAILAIVRTEPRAQREPEDGWYGKRETA